MNKSSVLTCNFINFINCTFLSDSPNLRRAHGTSVNKEMEWITGESVKEQSLLISFHWVRGIHVWFE